MTVDTASGDVQEQAREVYRQSLAAELTLTGKQLGEMFSRSERWGRSRIGEVRAVLDAGTRQDSLPFSGSVPDEVPAEQTAELPRVPAAWRQSEGQARQRATVPAVAERQPERHAASGAAPEVAVAAVPAVRAAGNAAIRRSTAVAVVVVAAVAAVVSYAHMQELAAAAGEGWRSNLLPLSVDGLLVAAALSMLVCRRHGRRPTALAWLALAAGLAASLAANVAAAEPTMAGRLIAAWPPVALALAFELLMQQVRGAGRRRRRTEEARIS